VISDNGDIRVDHDLPKGPNLKDILDVLNHRDINLWLDGKNIDRPEKCIALAGFLNKKRYYAERTMVEFPSNTDFDLDSLRICIAQLKNLGIAVSYYIPTKLGMECVGARSSRKESISGNSVACREFEEIVSKAIDSGLILEINFDIRLLELLSGFKEYTKLVWNTWGIGVEGITGYDQQKFRRIILNTNADPNSR
jgi:hypothetical protein